MKKNHYLILLIPYSRKARKKLAVYDIDVKDTQKHMRALMDENKALKLDLNVYETREKQLKEAMKNGAFDSLTKEDRDQFAFLREPLVRTYSKRVQQRHPHLMEETQDDEDDDEVDYDETGDSFEEVITLRNGREVRRSSNNLGGGAKRRSASAHATTSAAINSKRSRSRVMAATIDEEPVSKKKFFFPAMMKIMLIMKNRVRFNLHVAKNEI